LDVTYFTSSQALWSILFVVISSMIVVDVAATFKKANNTRQCIGHFLVFVGHSVFQFLFYQAVTPVFPVWCGVTMTIFSSLLAIRMNLIAVCKIKGRVIPWPLVPFYAAALYLYFGIPRITNDHHFLFLGCLTGITLWGSVYSASFVVDTVTKICNFSKIKCFSISKSDKATK